METVLALRGAAYKYYEKITALDGVSLSIESGQRVTVIGANGSGKSSLLQVLAGLMFPQSGEVLFKGEPFTEKSFKDAAFLRHFRSAVGYVFQDSDVQLFCPSVFDELVFGPLQMGMDEQEASGRAEEIMMMLGIGALRDRPPYMLSGGEKKKAAIGSVLTMNPEIILLDEPTTGLDPRTQAFLVELLFTLNDAGKTIVLSTHDLALVEELQGETVVLSEGHTIERTGSAGAILADEEMLLRVNLIHEHFHRHKDSGGTITHVHRHAHGD
ncbi:energy-coupling factor ABC transporter ATP-binding protein [Candidatus Magnetominusculus xianensis]|uniref:Nickel ABC transporter ATP-binding protein n=1 Tax=Candidatus Magnetominusculus xianensis TaxID=1748249 RepID=A0ABR5SH01_9BACT|nr:ABC transporter ATP-binding protein [Candidatus Magnetominusculus xianensis]KWT90951.1 nickel ABC transporter ATP-binding protein [Candidatus Magnetominusculus xianensis]MBF0403107.1 ABC transporter ATP-binding protein [Nitrospirota bacterium]